MKSVTLTILATIILLIAGCAPANYPPIIASLQAEREVVPPSENCRIECIASNSEGGELNYEWQTSGGNMTGKGSTVTWTAPEEAGNYTITVVVTNEMGGEISASLSIKVAVNHPPLIELKTEKTRVTKSSTCTIECIALDPDEDELSYTWSASRGNISWEGAVATWVAPNAGGCYTIIVTVEDSRGGKVTDDIVFTVESG